MKFKKGFILREVCGENIIVAEGKENIDFNAIISMNETATFIWQNVSSTEFTISDMATCLLNEYEVEEDTALADCTELAKQWIDAGIIE